MPSYYIVEFFAFCLFISNLLVFQDFYHTILCIRAIIAASWCWSVRLSRSCIVSKRPGSTIILVSWGHPVLPNTKRNSLSRGFKYTGVGKICDNWNRCSSRKQYEISPCLLWIVIRKSYVANRSVSVPMTSSDLKNVCIGAHLRSRP